MSGRQLALCLMIVKELAAFTFCAVCLKHLYCLKMNLLLLASCIAYKLVRCTNLAIHKSPVSGSWVQMVQLITRWENLKSKEELELRYGDKQAIEYV